MGSSEPQSRFPGVTYTSILWGGGQGWSGHLSAWKFSPLESWYHKALPSLICRDTVPWATQLLLPALATSPGQILSSSLGWVSQFGNSHQCLVSGSGGHPCSTCLGQSPSK